MTLTISKLPLLLMWTLSILSMAAAQEDLDAEVVEELDKDYLLLRNEYGAGNCINHPGTDEQDIEVEETEIYRRTMLTYTQDPVDYWWRYDIFFHKTGVNCSLNGKELKVYVHSDGGGLAVDGTVSRLKTAGERWGDWTNEDDDLADGGQQFPDPYPDDPTCEVFLR